MIIICRLFDRPFCNLLVDSQQSLPKRIWKSERWIEGGDCKQTNQSKIWYWMICRMFARKFGNLLFVQREMKNKWISGGGGREGGFTQKVHQSRNFVIDSSHPAEPVSSQSQKEKSFINQVPSKYSPHPSQSTAD